MGTQQLLLIVLAMIALAVAIAIGNLLFEVHSESATKDSITSESIHIGTMAQQYFNKTKEMGGGNKSFIGWKISGHLDSTSSGTYTIVNVNDDKLILKGSPISDMDYDWAVKSTVTKEEIITEIMD